MKIKPFILFVLGAVLFLSPNLYAQSESEQNPVISVAQPHYKFDLVLEGDEVAHDFVVQNKGNADLRISRVHTG